MKNEIIEKISRELEFGIDTQSKVVYLLAEIRKIMSLTNNRTISLRVFSDWVLHNELTYRNTITYFSNKFESYININSNSKEVSRVILSNQREFLKLNEF